jgi:hypothetical protein
MAGNAGSMPAHPAASGCPEGFEARHTSSKGIGNIFSEIKYRHYAMNDFAIYASRPKNSRRRQVFSRRALIARTENNFQAPLEPSRSKRHFP